MNGSILPTSISEGLVSRNPQSSKEVVLNREVLNRLLQNIFPNANRVNVETGEEIQVVKDEVEAPDNRSQDVTIISSQSTQQKANPSLYQPREQVFRQTQQHADQYNPQQLEDTQDFLNQQLQRTEDNYVHSFHSLNQPQSFGESSSQQTFSQPIQTEQQHRTKTSAVQNNNRRSQNPPTYQEESVQQPSVYYQQRQLAKQPEAPHQQQHRVQQQLTQQPEAPHQLQQTRGQQQTFAYQQQLMQHPEVQQEQHRGQKQLTQQPGSPQKQQNRVQPQLTQQPEAPHQQQLNRGQQHNFAYQQQLIQHPEAPHQQQYYKQQKTYYGQGDEHESKMNSYQAQEQEVTNANSSQGRRLQLGEISFRPVA